MLTSQLPIGSIVGPQGIKGQLRVKPFTSIPQSLSAYGPVTTDNGHQLRLRIMSVNSKGMVVVRAEGVETRDAAEALRGATLYISRDSLPDLGDGEFYHADLIGMRVKGQDGTELGSLTAIHDFGAGEIAELATGSGPTIMVPFGGEHLISVDLVEKELSVSIPDGLLDAPTVSDETVGGGKAG